MRTPIELMELFIQYESKNDFDNFAKSLCYEEVSMIIMTIELMIKNPGLTSSKTEVLHQALDFFKNIKKQHIERN